MNIPQCVLITGASSGIGKALALCYAAPGVTLCLMGRNHERLSAVAASCLEKGAEVRVVEIDVRDKAAMNAWIQAMDDQKPIELIIADAGISAGSGGGGESHDQALAIFDTNIQGVVNTVQPILSRMCRRESGQIALVSSLAGFRALPSSPAYSASKAGIRFYGEALRGLYAKHGVKVNVICPGYVKTPMTAVNNFPMPFLMNAEKAAVIIQKRLQKNRARIAFPFPMYALVWFLGIFPPWLTDPLFSRLPGKPPLAHNDGKY